MKYLKFWVLPAITLFAAGTLAIIVPASPATSAPSCNSSTYGSGGVVTCRQGNPGRAGRGKVPGWVTVARYTDRTCTDGNGNVSYRGDLYNPSTGATLPNYCLLSANPGNQVQIIDEALVSIPAPKPQTNFGDRFLTGAEVQFEIPSLTNHIQTLDLFPGATLVANPTRVLWDFGDGTTSTDFFPKHTFTSVAPDKNNPDTNAVTVTVTGTWNLFFHPAPGAGGGPVQDLGEISLTGELQRPIVEVWSAQTEPVK